MNESRRETDCQAAVINFRYMANAVWTANEAVQAIEQAAAH